MLVACVPEIMSAPVMSYDADAGPVAPTVLIDAPPLEADIDSAIVISFAINYPHLGTLPEPFPRADGLTASVTPLVVVLTETLALSRGWIVRRYSTSWLKARRSSGSRPCSETLFGILIGSVGRCLAEQSPQAMRSSYQIAIQGFR